jgi:hypothetical protein
MSKHRNIKDFATFRKEAEACQTMPLYTKNMIWEPVKLKNLHEFELFEADDYEKILTFCADNSRNTRPEGERGSMLYVEYKGKKYYAKHGEGERDIAKQICKDHNIKINEDQQLISMSPANPEAQSKTYMYHINKDTKEDFHADVRDQDGKIIYEIEGRGIFETDGGMKDKDDLVGLTKMLQAKNKIRPSDTIVPAEKFDGTQAGVQIAAPFNANPQP